MGADKRRQKNSAASVSIFKGTTLYSKDSLEACRQVLNDVVSSLSDYADKFYLAGSREGDSEPPRKC